MYCGIKDGRRTGHRCLPCKEAHQRCIGRPCSHCVKRGNPEQCVTPNAMKEMPIIPYRQSVMEFAPRLKRQPSNPFIYTQIFFELTSTSALPLMRAFSVDSINSIRHQNALVQRAVSLVGKAYVTQSNHSLITPQELSSDLRQTVEDFKDELMKNIGQCDPGRLEPILLSACLISIVELLLCNRGNTWCSLIYRIITFVQKNHHHTRQPSQLELDLNRFLRASDVIISILFDQDIFESPLGSFSAANIDYCDMPESYPEQWDLMIQHLAAWGRLQYWSLLWMASIDDEEKREALNRHHPNFDRTTLGIDLVNYGARLQRTIISHILTYSSLESSAYSAIQLYYYWALTGVSQLFRGSQWQSLGVHLPTMNDEMAHEQAIRTFDQLEQNLMALRLDAIVYIPVLPKIGSELRSTYERQRMLDVIRALRNKGIAVTDEVEKDLRISWAMLDRQSQHPLNTA